MFSLLSALFETLYTYMDELRLNIKSQTMESVAISLSYKEPMDIKFTNLTYSINKKREEPKILLNNVSGNFLSGRLTAVLGPSGAGKSSLLNVLSGFK